MSTTNIAIVNEFVIEADDYHEFISIRASLNDSVGLTYRYKEIDALKTGKPYRALFTLVGIRHPAQYSADIE